MATPVPDSFSPPFHPISGYDIQQILSVRYSSLKYSLQWQRVRDIEPRSKESEKSSNSGSQVNMNQTENKFEIAQYFLDVDPQKKDPLW